MKNLHPHDYSKVMQVRYYGLKHLKKNNSRVISAEMKKLEELLETIAPLTSPAKEQAFVEGIFKLHNVAKLAA